MADDAWASARSSPVAVAAALADMSEAERAAWRLAEVADRAPIADRNLDFPFPSGWFPALLSDELAPGQVRPLRYFGRDLVAWRGEDGAVRMLDAYCRHLGAHLGYGGRVVGNEIECPFHAWRYDGSGVVRDIPYASAIPARLTKPCRHQWPVTEANRMIWFWFHPAGAPPTWEVEAFPETADPAWTDYEIHEWVVFTPIRNMAENAVDAAHFRYVHGTATFPESRMTWDGVRRSSHLEFKLDTPAGQVDGGVTARQFGPGQSATRFFGLADTLLVAAVTPVEMDRTRVRFCFTQPRAQAEGPAGALARGFIAEVCRQLDQDKVIWDRQRTLEKPIVCDGDGPILQMRAWYAQFEHPEEPAAA